MTTTLIDNIKSKYSELVVTMILLQSVGNTSWVEYFYRSMAVMMYLESIETYRDEMFSTKEYSYYLFKIKDIIPISDVTEVNVDLPSGNYRITSGEAFRIAEDSYRIV